MESLWLVSCINLSLVYAIWVKRILLVLPEKFPLPKKFFVVNFFNQSTYPILNTIVVIWAKVVVEKFLFQSLFGNLFFILKFKVITLIIVTPITKLCFRTAIVLFPTMITFYETYCVFGILLSGLWMWKNSSCGPELSATSILGKTDLTGDPSNFIVYIPFIPIIRISLKTFLCCSSGASKLWNSSKMFLMLLNIR